MDKTKRIENHLNASNDPFTVIRSSYGWRIFDFKELKEYRDLFFFLVWRDIKVLYAQTIMGLSWAVLVPLIQIMIFTIIFGKIARISTDGVPYILFSTMGIIPWTYLSNSMTKSSMSLVAEQHMLGKIYFPRILFPLTPVLASLVDFFISILIIVIVIILYGIIPTWNLIFLPLFIVLMISIAAGVGFWFSALAIRFRDVKHAVPFLFRMLMYSAPIVYSASSVPEKWRVLYSINPIVGVIEGFRACFLGTTMPWPYILPGIASSLIILMGGYIYFKRMETIFVDVI